MTSAAISAGVGERPPLFRRLLTWGRGLPQRFVGFAWDNPSAEHDARTILSSPKVGMWLGIEILLILAACAITLFGLPAAESDFRFLGVAVGIGPYLVASCMLMLTLFLTFIVPLRASGLMEGPRWRGYMDQLVTTGMSPVRYYAGKWATSQPFFLALLAASVPFVMLFGLLGEISWARTFVSYLVLYGYCNLLLLVAFSMGAVMHEVVALLLTWLLFAFLVVLEFFPLPSSLAALTPIRFLIQPFVEYLGGSQAHVLGPLYGAARPFGVEVPWPLWAAGLWSLIGSCVAVTCTLGPLHAYVPGMNNFGAVVLAGDSKRAFFRRLRPFLSRRVELAFLFENRGPRLVRWTLPLRSLQQFVLLSLLAFLLFSAVFDPIVLKEVLRQGTVRLHSFAASLALLVSVLVFSSGRIDALQRFKLGPISIPQVVFDACAFVCFLAVLAILHVAGFAVGWENLVQARSSFWSPLSPEDVFFNASANLAVLMAVAVSTFLMLKLVGTRVLGRGWVFVAGLVYILALFLLPLIAFGTSEVFARSGDPLLSRFATPFFVLGEISPGVQMLIINDGPIRWASRSGGLLVEKAFWMWHVPWILFLGTLVVVSQRSVAKEAAILAGEVPEPDGVDAVEGAKPDRPPPCSECGSRRSVPVGITWWGGWILTRLAGTVRCVDCRSEYSPKTGAPEFRIVFMAAALRIFLALVGALICCAVLMKVLL